MALLCQYELPTGEKSVHVSHTEAIAKTAEACIFWLCITKLKPVQLLAQHHKQSMDVRFKVTEIQIICCIHSLTQILRSCLKTKYVVLFFHGRY